MTGMPETILARELELCYASIAVITNFAAGILEQPLTVKEVIDTMAQSSKRLNILLKEILLKVDDSVPCSCNSALKEASF
jgi:5'-methylthioadenosine phosphorylase